MIDYELSKYNYVGGEDLMYCRDYLEHSVKCYNDLFETEEETQEYLEFGNVTRTERLELPTWKEFLNTKTNILNFPNFNFITGKKEYRLFGSKKYDVIEVIVFGQPALSLFVGSFSKESYDEARRLCVKLFKGESE